MEAAGYRYILQKYSGPESRFVCPSCGSSGKFTRFVNAETGETLADHVGMCARINSCGYKYTPGQYFQEHPDARPKEQGKTKYSPSLIVNTKGPADPMRNTIQKKLIDALYQAEAEEEEGRPNNAKRWPYRALYGSENRERRKELLRHSAFHTSASSSILVGFLTDMMKARGKEKELQEVLKDYKIGSWHFSTVFWYADIGGRIRTGKVMSYKEDGHRDHERQPWLIHGKLKQSGLLPEDWELRRCLFGEHLLRKYPGHTVALVESEKTALIASVLLRSQPVVWLAAGGLQYLSIDSCRALKGRKVVVYPDLRAFDEWKALLRGIAPHVGFTFSVSDLLEKKATEEEREKGLDIADYLLK